MIFHPRSGLSTTVTTRSHFLKSRRNTIRKHLDINVRRNRQLSKFSYGCKRVTIFDSLYSLLHIFNAFASPNNTTRDETRRHSSRRNLSQRHTCCCVYYCRSGSCCHVCRSIMSYCDKTLNYQCFKYHNFLFSVIFFVYYAAKLMSF